MNWSMACLDLLKNDKGLTSNSFLPYSLFCSSQAFSVSRTISAFRTILFPTAVLLILCSLPKMHSIPPFCRRLLPLSHFIIQYSKCSPLASGRSDTLVTPAKCYVHRQFYFTRHSPPGSQRSPQLPKC